MGAVKPQKARFVYFFRKLSSLTTLEAASSGLASGLAAASGLASLSAGAPSEGRFSGDHDAGWNNERSIIKKASGKREMQDARYIALSLLWMVSCFSHDARATFFI